MPSGTATKSSVDQASDLGCRDALDGVIDRVLKRNLRKKTARPVLPLAALPEETLLQYVDGALHLSSHQEVEQHLLFDPEARSRVATLSAALSEVYGDLAPRMPEPGRPAHYLFLYAGGTLRFLRGTDLPLEPTATTPCFEFLHDFGPFSSHLRIESSSTGTLDLLLALHSAVPGCEVRLMRGPQLVCSERPDGEGRVAFRGLCATRHAVEICSDQAPAARAVIDIRGE